MKKNLLLILSVFFAVFLVSFSPVLSGDCCPSVTIFAPSSVEIGGTFSVVLTYNHDMGKEGGVHLHWLDDDADYVSGDADKHNYLPEELPISYNGKNYEFAECSNITSGQTCTLNLKATGSSLTLYYRTWDWSMDAACSGVSFAYDYDRYPDSPQDTSSGTCSENCNPYEMGGTIPERVITCDSHFKLVEVNLPTTTTTILKNRCIVRPDPVTNPKEWLRCYRQLQKAGVSEENRLYWDVTVNRKSRECVLAEEACTVWVDNDLCDWSYGITVCREVCRGKYEDQMPTCQYMATAGTIASGDIPIPTFTISYVGDIPPGGPCDVNEDCSTNNCVAGTCDYSDIGGACIIHDDCSYGANKCVDETGGPCDATDVCTCIATRSCYKPKRVAQV